MAQEKVTLTYEEKVERKNELRKFLETDVIAFNKATKEDDAEGIRKAENAFEEHSQDYKVIARHIVYDDCRKAENAIIEAANRLTYTYLSKKDTTVNKRKVRTLTERTEVIDLYDMDEYLEGVGLDEVWKDKAQRLNYALTLRVAVDLGNKPDTPEYKEILNKYRMTEAAKAIRLEIEQGKTPFSNTQLLKTLEGIFMAMVGDNYKPKQIDVAFLREALTKRKKDGCTIQCANHREFYRILLEVSHRMITDKTHYNVSAKLAK